MSIGTSFEIQASCLYLCLLKVAPLTHGHFDGVRFAVAEEDHLDRLGDRRQADEIHEVIVVRNPVAVELQNDVANLHIRP